MASEIRRFSPDDDAWGYFGALWGTEHFASTLDVLKEALPAATTVYVVGGTLRRAVRSQIQGVLEPLGDLDVILDGVDTLRLSPDELGGRVAINAFGGVRWFPRSGFRHVDVWRLSDHYSIREFKRSPTIEEALQGFPFDLERAAVDVTHGVAFDGGMLAAATARRIEFDARDRYLPHLQAIRGIRLERRTGYCLGPQAIELVMARPWRSKLAEMEFYLREDGMSDDEIAALFVEAESRADALVERRTCEGSEGESASCHLWGSMLVCSSAPFPFRYSSTFTCCTGSSWISRRQ